MYGGSHFHNGPSCKNAFLNQNYSQNRKRSPSMEVANGSRLARADLSSPAGSKQSQVRRDGMLKWGSKRRKTETTSLESTSSRDTIRLLRKSVGGEAR